MDSQEDQGKSSKVTSTASSTIGSEENQQTNCQLTVCAPNWIRHLEYSNQKDIDLTTRRQSQASTPPKAPGVRKLLKRLRCGERLANGRICGRTHCERLWISSLIKVVHGTDPSSAKQPVEGEAVDVQIPEWWCPLDPPIQVQPKKPEVCDNRSPGTGKMRQVIMEAIWSAPDEHFSPQEIKKYIAKRNPWYMQLIREKRRLQSIIKCTLNNRISKPFEQVPEMQGQWRVTASCRRELRDLESLPVFSTE